MLTSSILQVQQLVTKGAKLKLTIGMAVHRDWNGVVFTVQALRLFHPEVMKDAELVIIDNAPQINGKGEPVGLTLLYANLLSKISECRGVKLVPYGQAVGTSAPRNHIFQHATGDVVVCMDCHLLLPPGSLKAAVDWFAARPESKDILQGPLVYDDLNNLGTHFADIWRGQMWGVWAQGWRCSCDPFAPVFSPLEKPGGGHGFFKSTYPLEEVESCGHCGRPYPQIGWSGHEGKLIELGYIQAGKSGPAFPIGGQGLGLFACRRDAWPGFNLDARGFGGEEMYVHEKCRLSGGQTYCLPDFKWWHRFGNPDSITYPLSIHGKVRNYLLEFEEIAKDYGPGGRKEIAGIGGDGAVKFAERERERCRLHFVDELKSIPAEEFDKIAENPVAAVEKACGTCGTGAKKPEIDDRSMEQMFEYVQTKERDLNKHVATLKEYAAKCEHVTEISKRRESTIALSAGEPAALVSYQIEDDPIYGRVEELRKEAGLQYHRIKSHEINPGDFAETDLLFIDSRHTFERSNWELSNLGSKVRKYIIFHDTELHGNQGEDGKQPGLLAAIRAFTRANPEWRVAWHTSEQYGLTVLSRVKDENPSLPSFGTQVWNFAKAMATAASAGFPVAAEELVQIRLDTCAMCSIRTGSQCSKCGCYLDERPDGGPGKAILATSECDFGFWKEAEEKGAPIVPQIVKGG
jgi:glycosyltransferase involved in cell wall biosynthesis